ncbi:MAG: hypothetical protein RL338_1905 [Chloroflexota bacterium]
MAIAVAIAVAMLCFAGTLVGVGIVLFLGEALFGSIGWGILHGTLLALGIAAAALVGALRIPGSHPGRALLVGILLGLGAGLALGTGFAAWGWGLAREQFAEPYLGGILPEYRTLLTAVVAVGAVAGIVAGLRGFATGRGAGGRLGGLVGGLVAGALVGAALGAATTVELPARIAAALGVAVALATWPLLTIAGLRDLDPEALKDRFYPTATVATARETLEWLQRIRG